MGVFEFFKQLVKGWEPKEPQKQLPAGPSTIRCGLGQCNWHFYSNTHPNYIFAHWFTHIEERREDPVRAPTHDGPVRSGPVPHSVVFIIRRPAYQWYKPHFDLEYLTSEYFAFAMIALKQDNSRLRFHQCIASCTGDTGDPFLPRTLLVFASAWTEEQGI